jgi:hypothetical protein
METDMAQTTTPITITSAPAPTAKPAPAAPTPGQIRQRAWRDAEELARSITGYDKASPIYGKTDLEVLASVKASLLLMTATAPRDLALLEIDQLIARKGARQLAGVTYRGKK